MMSMLLVALLAAAPQSQKNTPPADAPPPAPVAMPVSISPLGDPSQWVGNKDYPKAARKAQHQGRVAMRLTIDRKGLVVGCTITASSGYAELDTAACDAVHRRGRFVIGKDAPSDATTFNYNFAVNWSL